MPFYGFLANARPSKRPRPRWGAIARDVAAALGVSAPAPRQALTAARAEVGVPFGEVVAFLGLARGGNLADENYTDKYMIAAKHRNNPSAVRVGPHPGDGWARLYEYARYTGGDWPPADPHEHGQGLLNEAAHLMFEGADPNQVLQEFAKIEAWRELRDVQFVGYRADRVFIPGKPEWNPHNPDPE